MALHCTVLSSPSANASASASASAVTSLSMQASAIACGVSIRSEGGVCVCVCTASWQEQEQEQEHAVHLLGSVRSASCPRPALRVACPALPCTALASGSVRVDEFDSCLLMCNVQSSVRMCGWEEVGGVEGGKKEEAAL